MKALIPAIRNLGCGALLATFCFVSACQTNSGFPLPNPVDNTNNPGTNGVDFTRYVALGNSLTAGFADGGLYRESQENSYPAIIAQQMKKAGGGAFVQPLFGATEANGSGFLKLTGMNPYGTPILTAVTTGLAVRGTQQVGGRTVTLYTKYTGSLNNYGVPGIKLADINDANYGNLNGYFERLLAGNSPNNNTTYLNFATQGPFTFFSNWLGNNDALSFATSGGVDTLTDKSVFGNTYSNLLTRLTANGARGVVATIPDVTAIPYLNAITMSSVIAAVQKVNPTAKVYISARNGSGGYAAREAKITDLVVLEFPLSKLGTGTLPYGLLPSAPIENKYVLDESEIALAQNYTAAYNSSIKQLASAKGLAVFDAHAYLNDLKNGVTVNGVTISTAYLTGGAFSVDGIHLTPRGYALLANQFIQTINAHYGTQLAQVDVSSYRTLKQ